MKCQSLFSGKKKKKKTISKCRLLKTLCSLNTGCKCHQVANLISIPLWANSTYDKIDYIFFLLSPENGL